MNASLEVRLRQLRSRVLIRAWSYRQRHHGQGVWFRLRRALTHASAVYAITRAEADELIAQGHRVEPVGQELAPPKVIVVAPALRIARIASARPLPVSLGAELLAAECLALVPFEG